MTQVVATRTAVSDAGVPARRGAGVVSPAGVAIVGVGYLGTVAAIDPYQPLAIGCPIHAATGGFCPGCGSTRAVHELLHGDIVASIACHPLAIPVIVLLGYLWVSWAVRRRGAHRWARSATELPAAVPMILAVAFVALTVVRNVPGLEWLTPPDLAL